MSSMFNENALQEIDQAVCSIIMGEEASLYSHPQHGFIDFCTGLSSLEQSKNINMRKEITFTWLKTDKICSIYICQEQVARQNLASYHC